MEITIPARINTELLSIDFYHCNDPSDSYQSLSPDFSSAELSTALFLAGHKLSRNVQAHLGHFPLRGYCRIKRVLYKSDFIPPNPQQRNFKTSTRRNVFENQSLTWVCFVKWISFRSIPVSFRSIPVSLRSIPVSFRYHSGPFRSIPAHSGSFRSIPFRSGV